MLNRLSSFHIGILRRLVLIFFADITEVVDTGIDVSFALPYSIVKVEALSVNILVKPCKFHIHMSYNRHA